MTVSGWAKNNRETLMLAPLATLAFLATVWLLVRITLDMIDESGVKMLAALRGLRPRATLSRDAGRYLCNYLCWRAAETASTGTGPRLATFIHVPPVRRGPRRKRDKVLASLNGLTVAGGRALVALVTAARR